MFKRLRRFMSSLSCVNSIFKHEKNVTEPESKSPEVMPEQDNNGLKNFLSQHNMLPNRDLKSKKDSLSEKSDSSINEDFDQAAFDSSLNDYEDITFIPDPDFDAGSDEELQFIYDKILDAEARRILAPQIPRTHIWTLKKGDHVAGGHGLVRQGKLYVVSVRKPNSNKRNFRIDKRYIAAKKILKPSSFMDIELFLNEISILKCCDHPNVLKFLGVVFLRPMKIYLITEFCDGHDLWHLLYNSSKWKTTSMCDLVHIGTDMAKGMEHLRKKNILHRDFKSSNVLLFNNRAESNSEERLFRPKWVAKIADFGTALSLSCGYSKLNKNMDYWTTITGNFQYSAPEAQSDLEMPINYKYSSDLYSLGIVFVELVFGNHPFFQLNEKEIFQLGARRRLFFDEIKVRYDTPASFVKLIWACTFHEPIYRLHIADVVTWIERIRQEEILNYSSKSNVRIDSAKMTYKLRPQFENEIQLPNINLLRIIPAEKAIRVHHQFSKSIIKEFKLI